MNLFSVNLGRLFIVTIWGVVFIFSVFMPSFLLQNVHADDADDHAEPDYNYAAIVVHLEPDIDNAQITARRATSGDIGDYLNGGNDPAADTYTNFTKDGDAYVKNNVNIFSYCESNLNYVNEFLDFTISVQVDGVDYETGNVRVDCNEVSEITLRERNDDSPGTVILGINYHDCSDDDGLKPFPSAARVEIDGVDQEPTYRQNENRGIFTFSDIENGTYNFSATYLDAEGDGSSRRGYVYEATGQFEVNNNSVRKNKTAIGEPLTTITDETPECQFGNDPDELPPIDSGDLELSKYEKCLEELDFPGNFLICWVIDFIDDQANNWIEKVDELLSVGSNEYNSPELQQAWSYFRNIASLLLVVIGLVMIIGQGISKE